MKRNEPSWINECETFVKNQGPYPGDTVTAQDWHSDVRDAWDQCAVFILSELETTADEMEVQSLTIEQIKDVILGTVIRSEYGRKI